MSGKTQIFGDQIVNGTITNTQISATAAISSSKITPPGSTLQLIYNNAGVFAGTANITTDGTNVTLSSSGGSSETITTPDPGANTSTSQGSLTLTSGNTNFTNNSGSVLHADAKGANLTLTSGNSAASGAGNGSADVFGGTLTLTSGNATGPGRGNANGGSILLTTGTSASGNPLGGGITLTTGNSGNPSGGSVTLSSGTGFSTTGGSLTLSAGDSTSIFGGSTGGSITLTAGLGGAGGSTGGSILLTTGNTQNGGQPVGGSITLTASSAARGGNLSLTGTGASHGTITAGGNMAIDGTTFNVDSVNHKVGIGTSTPSQLFDIGGGHVTWNDSTATFTIFKPAIGNSLIVGDFSSSGIVSLPGFGQVRFGDVFNSSNYVGLQAPHITSTYIIKLPVQQATVSGQALTNDGTGQTSWTTIVTAPAGANTQIQFNNAGSFGASSGLTWDGTSIGVASINAAGTLSLTNNTTNLQFAYLSGYTGYRNINFRGNSGDDLFLGLHYTSGTPDYTLLDSYNSPLAIRVAPANTILLTSTATGAVTDASAIARIDSTTQGFLPPRMTTTQKNAIASPSTGLIVFDTTLGYLQEWNGSAWTNVAPGSPPAGSSGQLQYNNGGAFGGALSLTTDGTKLSFKDSGSNTVSFQAPTAITSSYAIKWPTAQGAANQAMVNDGSGNLSWGSTGTGSVTQNTYTVGTPSGTYTGSTTVFNLPFTYVQDGKSLQVMYNGQVLVSGVDYSETSNTSVTFTNPLTVGYTTVFRYITPQNPSNTSVAQYVNYVIGTASGTYTGSTTVYNLPFAYTQDGKSLGVFYDGVQLIPGDDYTETTSTSITTTMALTSGQKIAFRTISTIGNAAAVTALRENYVVGTPNGNYTGSTTVFNLINSYVPGGINLQVYVDGDLQTVGVSNDYQETNTTTVTFNFALTSGQTVAFLFSQTVAATGTVTSATSSQIAYYPSTGSTIAGLTTPAAHIHGGNSTAVTTTSTVHKFQTVDFDNTSSYSPTTGLFTCPIAGKYRVSACVIGSVNTTAVVGSGSNIQLVKNGGTGMIISSAQSQVLNAAVSLYMTGGLLVNCAAGDTLAVYIQKDTNIVAYNTAGSTDVSTYMDVEFVPGA